MRSGSEEERDRIEILDHGYLELVEHWGSDERIVESARMSTNKGFKGWGHIVGKCADCSGSGQERCPVTGGLDPCSECDGEGVERVHGDERLLAYLYRNKHSTPFEMAGLTIEVKAPIFVYRQWHRHRTQSYNEMSARYTPLPDEDYVPTVERLMVNSTKNKQAGKVSGAGMLDLSAAESFREQLREQYGMAEKLYRDALAAGMPKELARIHLPVARYSRMRASANLRNWLGFLTLRMDPHAQWEIRQYANALGEIIKKLYPRTWELFLEGFNGKA